MLSKNRFLLLVLILLHAGVVGVGKKKLAKVSFRRTARRVFLVMRFPQPTRVLGLYQLFRRSQLGLKVETKLPNLPLGALVAREQRDLILVSNLILTASTSEPSAPTLPPRR